MEKRCPKCRTPKDIEEFNKSTRRKDGRQPVCRECGRGYNQRYYRGNKEHFTERQRLKRRTLRKMLGELKGRRGCKTCGEKHPACLDFHHPKGNKESAVSLMVSDLRPKKVILAEVRKCLVLCSNCHRKLHFGPGEDGV